MEEKLKKANEELLAALNALRESEARQAGIIASAMDGIISIDSHGTITVFNAAAERMFGHPAQEMIGRKLEELIPGRFREKHAVHIQRFGQTNVTHRAMGALGAITGLRASGEEFPIEASISQMGSGDHKLFTVIMRDITEKRRIEEQFMRAQRMESIGSLASGIAHDLNNILSPILMSITMLKARTTDAVTLNILSTIDTSAKRGAEIVRQVLSFARGMDGQRIGINLRNTANDVEVFVRDTFPKNISLKVSVPGDVWTVLGDPTQLHQLLLNLCVNARDAMVQGGQLTLAAENTVIDDHAAALNIEAKAGPYVVFSVTDTGVGIPRGVIDKIFDPFFTTKDFGKGTGLGLSTVAAIAKSHGGFVHVYSEIGKGTTFKVYLPAVQSAATAAASEKSAGIPRGNGEKILVVDDEAEILAITAQTLQAFGYEVITAADGAEAIALYAQHRDEIAAVLTDMMMPVMDGASTIRALRRIHPAVKVIAASGLETNGNAANDSGTDVRYFLKKPYTAESLLSMLRDILKS
jgi:PAS domain S-box-containing protein